jgi:hypothetical protein
MIAMRILLGLFGLLSLPLSVVSQQPASAESECKQYFGVLWQNEKIPGGFMPRMSKEQEEWWRKKGARKYRGVCLNPEKATYWIVWTTEVQTVEVDAPKVRTAITTTQVPAVVGTPAMSGGKQISPAPVGTATTTSTTVWTEHRTEKRSYEYASLFVFTTDGKPVSQGGQLVTPPAFYSEHVGQWIWSKPTKDAFEDALKFMTSRESR